MENTIKSTLLLNRAKKGRLYSPVSLLNIYKLTMIDSQIYIDSHPY